MENLKDLVDKYKPFAKELLKNLVSFKSVLDEYRPDSEAPFGIGNKEALEYLLNKGIQDGFSVRNTDNFAGHIEFGQGEEILGILAHLDVVPVVESEWVSDPFTLSERNGRLYARGSIDDKGPLAAAYTALKILKDIGFRPKKRVRLIAGCDEESGSRCLQHYFMKEEKPSLGFSPDADFPLIYGEKGMLSYDVYGSLPKDIILEFQCGQRYNIVPSEARMKLSDHLEKEYIRFLEENHIPGKIQDDWYIAYGVAAHAMCPEKGKNAAYILFDFLSQYSNSVLASFFKEYYIGDTSGEKMGYAIYDEDMKALTSNVAVVQMKNGEFKIGVNCRVPSDNHFSVIESCVEKACVHYGFSYRIISLSKRHYVDPKGPLLQTLMRCYREITGDTAHQPITIGGGTYAREIGNAVAFGPVFPEREDVCHIANEYMIEEDLYKAIEIYLYAIYELSKS